MHALHAKAYYSILTEAIEDYTTTFITEERSFVVEKRSDCSGGLFL